MSYAAKVKEELCRSTRSEGAPAMAEAYGVLLFCSRFNTNGVRIVTQSEDFAGYIPGLFRAAMNITFDRVPEVGHQGKFVFEINRPDKMAVILTACGYEAATLSMHINYGLLEDNTCRLAFLRGAFLAGGAVTDPERAYHLELVTGHLPVSREVFSLMEECGFQCRVTERKSNYVIYIKRNAEISRFLQLTGAPRAADELQIARQDKGNMNKLNRQMNCDMANVDKTVAASQEQLQAINHLDESIGLTCLPEKLKEAAYLRIENPELSIAQLAEMCVPPVTKSTFNHRLKRLLELSRGEG